MEKSRFSRYIAYIIAIHLGMLFAGIILHMKPCIIYRLADINNIPAECLDEGMEGFTIQGVTVQDQ